jgi:hypothetical protein
MRTLLLILLLAGCEEPSALRSPLDLAVPDLATPFDLSVTMPDLTSVDLLSCSSTFLNSDAGDACALDCGAGIESVPDEGAVHVPMGTPVSYMHNPPASGNHWPMPAPWGVHTEVVPREWWVHNLEHGGIVLLYNCPSGCANDVDALTAIMNGQQPDKYNEVRMLLTADPLLPKKFAAVAWDWDWTGDTVDTGIIGCFIEARYGRGPEDIP